MKKSKEKKEFRSLSDFLPEAELAKYRKPGKVSGRKQAVIEEIEVEYVLILHDTGNLVSQVLTYGKRAELEMAADKMNFIFQSANKRQFEAEVQPEFQEGEPEDCK